LGRRVLSLEDRQKIFRGISIYVDSEEKPDFAILIEHDKIKEISLFSILREQFPTAQVFDFPGFIYPAFFDSHLHLGELSYLLSSMNGEKINSFFVLVSTINSSKEDPLYIYNLNFNNLTIKEWQKLFNLPRKIFIQSKDEHSVFVTKAFIESTGIKIKEVEGGVLERHSGNFVGIFKDKAIDLVSTIKERKTSSQHIELAFDYLLQRGIASVVNFDFSVLPVLINLKSGGLLKVRIVQGIKKDFLKDAVKEGIKTNDGDKFLKFGPVKCFMDGSLGSKTAYMESGVPFRGVLTMDEDELNSIVQFANTNGIQVAIHAIGSGAVRIVLNALGKYGRPEMRNRIEHLQFFDEGCFNLLKLTPFIASMQPIHAISDFKIFRRIMGDYRFAYAWNTVLKANKMLAFGSDAPVEDASPVLGINAAVKRLPLNESLPFQEEERVSIEEAFKAYTVGSSYATFSESYVGELKKGHLADFVILEKSLFSDNINNRVMGTILGGTVAWMK
jgi:hypothetical protein